MTAHQGLGGQSLTGTFLDVTGNGIIEGNLTVLGTLTSGGGGTDTFTSLTVTGTSTLSTTNVSGLLTLTGGQTMTGGFTYTADATPASIGTSPGTAAPTALTITGGVGGGSSLATSTGGVGGGITATLGAGGVSTGATASTGGAGGAFVVTAGAGGAEAAAGIDVGGAGGAITLTTGIGGASTVGSSKTGGAGGTLSLIAGAGGAGTTAGGVGGAIAITAGAAGTGGNINGGSITLTPGAKAGTGATGQVVVVGDLLLNGPPRLLTSQVTAPTIGSSGSGVSAVSVVAGSTNVAGQVAATLTGVAPGVVIGIVALNGAPLASTVKAVICSLSGPTAGDASPCDIGADTFTTSGFTLRSYGPTTVTTAAYVISYACFF